MAMRVKVGYLVPQFPSQTHAFFWREAQGLKAEGLDVAFVSTRRPYSEECRHEFAAEARRSTQYVSPPRLLRGLAYLTLHLRRTFSAISYVLALRETPWIGRLRASFLIVCAADLIRVCRDTGIDHLHIHSFADAAHLGALAHLLGDVPYSMTLHGDLPVYGTDHAQKVKNAKFVTAVTKPLRDQIAEITKRQDALVISMGVDVEKFVPSDTVRSNLTPLHIVTVARLNYTKGHAYLLEAIAALVGRGVDLRYSIAGSGPYREEIQAKICELGLEQHVTMLGSISEGEVLALLQSADILALTSFGLGEAAPVAVMEAMSCAIPVVCSRIGGTADMIESGVDGFLVNQQDVDDIAKTIDRLARDPALRKRIGGEARRTAVSKFDHRIMAGKLAIAIRTSLVRAPVEANPKPAFAQRH